MLIIMSHTFGFFCQVSSVSKLSEFNKLTRFVYKQLSNQVFQSLRKCLVIFQKINFLQHYQATGSQDKGHASGGPRITARSNRIKINDKWYLRSHLPVMAFFTRAAMPTFSVYCTLIFNKNHRTLVFLGSRTGNRLSERSYNRPFEKVALPSST